MASPDIIIVGGGIIGVSLALELRERGASVTVLDRSEPGKEASIAAAGMLAAADPETPAALRDFALKSARAYPEFVAKLEKLSGIDTDFRRQGAIILEERDHAKHSVPSEYRAITTAELQDTEPSISANGHSAYFLAEDSIDPVLLMQAALGVAMDSGVQFQSGAKVDEVHSSSQQLEVCGKDFRFVAKTVVDCRGAWSGAPVVPRKGQMLYLQPNTPGILQHVVRAPGAYIVPRSSGQILIGTTVEDAGYDKTVQADVINHLHRAAAKYVPDLAAATVSSSWAGLRPGTPDDLPIMGATSMPGVFIASGHFRNGILLAPLTARAMANVIEDKPAGLDISSFSPSRFSSPLMNEAEVNNASSADSAHASPNP